MNPQERSELIKYRLGKARETLNEVQLHVKHEL
jgi:hypothetical protein